MRELASRYFAQDPVDFGSSADIDTLCRLVGNDDARLGEQSARHHNLLLVAARQGKNGRFDARSLDIECAEPCADLLQFLLLSHNPELGELVECGKRRVFAHGEARSQAFGVPVRRHEGRRLQKFLGFQRTSLKTYGPLRGLKSGKRPHQFRLAITLDTGDTDDLPSRDLESYVVESFPAEGVRRENHFFRSVLRLRRKRRSERPSDDHIQEFRVHDLVDEPATPNPPVTQHGDAVSDLADLRKPMRDVDHRRSGLDDASDALEGQTGDMCIRTGGLVEHEDPWPDRECLGDLQEVLLCDR